ncbi:arginine repressor [Carnobacterium maltaromaticum]|uniref:arginine repressor n=1 Tax=Carnobacterium maltaromaticum TaxID=2751 RepID=UPI0039BE551E
MKKKERHQLLKELIQEHVIEKQEDFVRVLEEKGIEVTQATILRDIKELHLVKVPAQTGGYRYSLPPDIQFDTAKKLERLIKDAFVSIDYQDYFLVLKTIPGNAYALGKLIESSNFDGVFGTIAGDDTILIICRSATAANQIQDQLLSLV